MLACVKMKESKCVHLEVKPIARKLGERVYGNCAANLGESLGISLGDYSKRVASVCQGTTITFEQSSNVDILASKPPPPSAEEVKPPADRSSSPKSIVSNGVAENEEKTVDPNSSKETENEVEADADVSMTNNSDEAVAADLEDRVKSPVKPNSKQQQGAKTSSSPNSLEQSGAASSTFETEKPPVLPKNPLTENSDIETDADGTFKTSPQKRLTETVNIAPAAASSTSPRKKGTGTKKNEAVIEEEEDEKMPAVNDSSKKEEAEVATGGLQSAKKLTGVPHPKILAAVGTSKTEREMSYELKQSAKIDESSESDAKPQKSGKDTSAADDLTTTSKDVVKETVSSPKSTAKFAKDEDIIEETPKMDAKRKRGTPGTGKNKAYDSLGDAIWHGKDSDIKEGHKSFPSGMDTACLVGISRVDDYWHHWQDVFAGGLLGLGMATFCYLQFFPPPYHIEGWGPYAYFHAIEESRVNSKLANHNVNGSIDMQGMDH